MTMPKPTWWWRLGPALVTIAIVGGGCAAMRKSDVDTQEQLLSAAGFQMKLADTPQKLAHLQTLTSQKLVPHTRDGKLYYVYADPEFCKCVFVGNEPAYQKYQQLALQQKMSQERLNAAAMNENAAMNWGMWGPYWW
jgi:uncharacterized protein YdbL (DUF1318 family)